jgi:hypothetical protein
MARPVQHRARSCGCGLGKTNTLRTHHEHRPRLRRRPVIQPGRTSLPSRISSQPISTRSRLTSPIPRSLREHSAISYSQESSTASLAESSQRGSLRLSRLWLAASARLERHQRDRQPLSTILLRPPTMRRARPRLRRMGLPNRETPISAFEAADLRGRRDRVQPAMGDRIFGGFGEALNPRAGVRSSCRTGATVGESTRPDAGGRGRSDVRPEGARLQSPPSPAVRESGPLTNALIRSTPRS